MATEWKKVKLQEICESISDGDHLPPPKAEKGIPFVTISNIKDNQLDFIDTMFVPETYYEKLDNKRKAKTGDILYSVVGSFGIPVLLKRDEKFVFQRHIAILRPNKIESSFLYYTMLGRDFYAKADAAAIGAAQRTVSLTSLRNIEICLPPLETQQKIAGILSAYDNLIENNRKQIKLLEEAAQKLYKEWFVKLNFPGHENVKIVDGIPEGWKKGILSDFGDIITGKTPSKKNINFFGNKIQFIKIPDMYKGVYTINSDEHLSKEGAESQKNKFIPAGSLIVSCIGTAGLVCIAYEKCQTNQQINSIILINPSTIYYLYFFIKSKKKYLEALGSNGATMVNVNKDKFGKIEVIIPENSIMNSFSNFVAPYFERIKSLQNQIQLLQSARDKLLPKFMNGEINVK